MYESYEVSEFLAVSRRCGECPFWDIERLECVKDGQECIIEEGE